MKTILVIGAGLSASSLIRYLTERLVQENWQLKIATVDTEELKKRYPDNPRIEICSMDANDAEERCAQIATADLVISMLPAKLHPIIARDCIDLNTNLITPSYVSAEMKALQIGRAHV